MCVMNEMREQEQLRQEEEVRLDRLRVLSSASVARGQKRHKIFSGSGEAKEKQRHKTTLHPSEYRSAVPTCHVIM